MYAKDLRGLPLSVLVDVIQNLAESWIDSLMSWFGSSDSLLILVYQIRIYISCDNILWEFTRIIVEFNSWFQNYIDFASDFHLILEVINVI